MRAGGVLMHISSLPSRWGIGTLGKAAREFADFLSDSGQKYWQTLPVGPTGYGDSPYQSFSTYAGNPYFIDLDCLIEQGFLREEEVGEALGRENPDRVDYGELYRKRYPVLRQAVRRFREGPQDRLNAFCESERAWLSDYALFMALKDSYGGEPWYRWEGPLLHREPEALKKAEEELAEEIYFRKVLQFWFYGQWGVLKSYAGEKGIRLIGDLPIYVAEDSADVWANPGQFYLDDDLRPVDVAGCPPDAFSALGQLWGNPLYRWDRMAEDDYAWWFSRIGHAFTLCDVLRVDHFRGFDAYYAIPAGRTDAKIGEWRAGPGIRFFQRLEEKLGRKEIIAEDLGFLTESVYQMVRDSGFPGMKVLQFAFEDGGESNYLPYKYDTNCVVYAGTHDNDTILGWLASTPEYAAAFARKYFRLTKEEGFHWGVMRGALASVSGLAILTMQDILGLGSDARMNTPSTLGGNWEWRMTPGSLTPELAARLREYTQIYGR